jgi:hypothetical protein
MNSVYNYFKVVLDSEPGDISLESLPLDSACGRSCKKAIDAAAAFLVHVRASIGSEATHEIIETTDLVCQVYWRG